MMLNTTKVKDVYENLVQLRHWGFLGEANLSKVWGTFKESDKCVGIISAFTLPEVIKEIGVQEQLDSFRDKNVEYSVELAKEIKSEGFGYRFLDGFWVYTTKAGKELKVKEDSIMIIAQPDDEDRLFRFLTQKAWHYKQEAFIFKKANGETAVYDMAGSKAKQGYTFNSMKMDIKDGTMFSALKKGSHAGRKFVFESYDRRQCFAHNYINQLVLRQLNVNEKDLLF